MFIHHNDKKKMIVVFCVCFTFDVFYHRPLEVFFFAFNEKAGNSDEKQKALTFSRNFFVSLKFDDTNAFNKVEAPVRGRRER